MNFEKKAPLESEQSLLDHAEQLIWSFLDDHLEEQDVRRLEELMKKDEEVRLRYLQCAQIHADLYSHYQSGPDEPKPQSPVLGSLLSGLPTPLESDSSLVD
ncbi:MAG: hypothetical protein GXP28_11825 [Planctomycetes bacterium]|nr:hypothetical protein [Planctomycetota bacterium]